MFEWLCIFCLFSVTCIPKPIHRPDLVLMFPHTSRSGPKRQTRSTGGCCSHVFLLSSLPPPLYLCLAPQIDPIFLFFSWSQTSDSKGRNFIQNIFWLTLSTFHAVHYGISHPERFPPSQTAGNVLNIIYSSLKFLYQVPSSSALNIKKIQKKSKKLFKSRWIPVNYFSVKNVNFIKFPFYSNLTGNSFFQLTISSYPWTRIKLSMNTKICFF